MGKPSINIDGRRFGRLLVIGTIRKPGEKPRCKCQCDCGNVFWAAKASLIHGKTKSCGCLRREHAKLMGLKNGNPAYDVGDGDKVGRLTILSDFIHPDRPKESYKLCQCDCGVEVAVRFARLRNGTIKSCGCLRSEHAATLRYSPSYRPRRCTLYEGHALSWWAEQYHVREDSLRYHVTKRGKTPMQAIVYLLKKRGER